MCLAASEEKWVSYPILKFAPMAAVCFVVEIWLYFGPFHWKPGKLPVLSAIYITFVIFHFLFKINTGLLNNLHLEINLFSVITFFLHIFEFKLVFIIIHNEIVAFLVSILVNILITYFLSMYIKMKRQKEL